MQPDKNSSLHDRLKAIDGEIRSFLKRLPKRFRTHEMGMNLYQALAVATLKKTAHSLRLLLNYPRRQHKIAEVLLPLIRAVHRLWNHFTATISCYTQDLRGILDALENLLPADTAIQYDLFTPEEVDAVDSGRLVFPGFRSWAVRQKAVEHTRAWRNHFTVTPIKQFSLPLWRR